MREDQHMEHISHIGKDAFSAPQRLPAVSPETAVPAARRHADQPPAVPADKPVDQAEISALGLLLERAHDTTGIRADRVAEARQAIEQNEQAFIDERLQQTIDRLMDELL
jgi:ribosome assembly protein YihI (activator of Der GTPase)